MTRVLPATSPYEARLAARRVEEHRRYVEARKPYRWWLPPQQFDALEGLIREIESAELLLRGLAREHPKAVAEGRIAKWAAAARAIIALLEEPSFETERQRERARTSTQEQP